MPVGVGVMQMPRVTVVRTATEITSISPSITSVVCGDSIEIFFSVSSYDELLTVNDGYVTIIDLNTNTEIGGGTLLLGIGSTGSISGLSGILNLAAYYSGNYNQFSPSTSSTILYPIVRQNTTINITSPVSETYYCYYSPLNVDINVQSVGIGSPTGNVYLKIYSDNNTYTQLGPEEISPISGNVTIEMPAEYGNYDGYSKYLQAIYEGNYCFSPAGTSSGTGGVEIIPLDQDPEVTIVINSMPGRYLIGNLITFTSVVSTDLLPVPDGYDGYVQFSYSDLFAGPSTILGSSYMDNGTASLTVNGNTFSGIGSWQVLAEFYSDNPCYGPVPISDSTTIDII